ncbi:MAG: hypothetical protein QF464_17090, partial [Myxococcota bacterium]|nr:hypothetical protein [Myxococcota bacterium]
MIRLLSAFALVLSTTTVASAVSYNDDAQPILAAKCGPCHTASASGGHAIGTSYADGQLDSYHCADLDKAACSVERIKDGSMPNNTGVPGGCGGAVADDDVNADVCVTVSELATLEAWIAAGAPEEAVVDPGCTSDDDCNEGETCTDGACAETTTDPGCTSDDDCNEGEVCTDGACVDDGGDVVGPGCTEDTDCADGETCTDGACVEDTTDPGCTEDGDCADGETCTDNECVEATTDPVECTTDADCSDQLVCFEGACVLCDTVDLCGGVLECTEDGDCDAGEVCDDDLECVDAPDTGCTEDGDCATGEVCTEGACVEATIEPPDCTEDADCGAGNFCV